MGIDTVYKSFAKIEVVTHGLMVVVAGDLFSMPGGTVPNDHEFARPPSAFQPAHDSAMPFVDPKTPSREAWRLCPIRTLNIEL